MGRARSSVSEAELRCAERGLVIRVRDDGLGRRLGLAQHLRGDVAGGDLAQREHRRLVVLERQGGLRAVGEPPGALRRQQHQLEEVIDVVQAVFYGDSGHGIASGEYTPRGVRRAFNCKRKVPRAASRPGVTGPLTLRGGQELAEEWLPGRGGGGGGPPPPP